MLLKTFIDGLIYDLSIIVRAQQPKTFQNALDIALTVESDVGFPRKTSKNCNYCKTNTHDTRECRLIRNRNTNEITNNLNRPQTNYSQKPNLIIMQIIIIVIIIIIIVILIIQRILTVFKTIIIIQVIIGTLITIGIKILKVIKIILTQTLFSYKDRG